MSTVWSSTATTIVSTVTSWKLPSLCNCSDRVSGSGDEVEQKRMGTAPSVESLSTRRWAQQPKAQHEHTSTCEDGVLKLLGVPHDTHNRTRFEKRAKTYRTTSASGPLWQTVLARITIDEYRNLLSVRDIRVLLVH